MKLTKSILTLLSLILTFSCDDKEEELPNELSLDWILLKKGGIINKITDGFGEVLVSEIGWVNIESCNGYIECDYNDMIDEGVYLSSDCGNDEYVGVDCRCGNNNECGECILNSPHTYRVNSCSGYELCKLDGNDIEVGNYPQFDCCYEYEYNTYDSLGDLIGGEIRFKNREYHFYEYKLYWNNDLSVCNGSNCDIVIPSYYPNGKTNDCDGGGCESETYFHPNCDTPLDTTMMIGSKSISFGKMGWLDRESDNSLGYIIYLRNEEYLLTDGFDIDISNWKVVDYQRKE